MQDPDHDGPVREEYGAGQYGEYAEQERLEEYPVSLGRIALVDGPDSAQEGRYQESLLHIGRRLRHPLREFYQRRRDGVLAPLLQALAT
jgi:hypothetical protein